LMRLRRAGEIGSRPIDGERPRVVLSKQDGGSPPHARRPPVTIAALSCSRMVSSSLGDHHPEAVESACPRPGECPGLASGVFGPPILFHGSEHFGSRIAHRGLSSPAGPSDPVKPTPQLLSPAIVKMDERAS